MSLPQCDECKVEPATHDVYGDISVGEKEQMVLCDRCYNKCSCDYTSFGKRTNTDPKCLKHGSDLSWVLLY